MKKISLGIVKKNIKETQTYNKDKDNLVCLKEIISIEKHSWDCDWYWGFGYIGNKNLHTHSNIFIKELLWSDVKDVFVGGGIFKTNENFWVFKDLLKQAYSLSKVAEVYKYGGHCTTKKGVTDIIKNSEKQKQINNDLEIVLNTLWNFLLNLKKVEK